MKERKATEKQKDLASAISETLGIDLPNEDSITAYSSFISENLEEFKKVQNEIRYCEGDVFALRHSYVLKNGFCGDGKLNTNPETTM